MPPTDPEQGRRRVDQYLADAPQPQRDTLVRLRATLLDLLPRATEGFKYGMPAVLLDGKGVAGYAAFRAHCGYFPFSSTVLAEATDVLDGYTTSKGGLQFPVDRTPSMKVLRRLVRLRLDELGEVDNGLRRDYYDDGTVKAEGKVRGGELRGEWHWYRRDGSLLRTGSFRDGEQVGTWTSFDRDGTAVRVTEMG